MLRFEHIGPTDMARGPKGEYRPHDPIAAAAVVVRIATGQTDEATEAAKMRLQVRSPRSKSGATLEVRPKTRER